MLLINVILCCFALLNVSIRNLETHLNNKSLDSRLVVFLTMRWVSHLNSLTRECRHSSEVTGRRLLMLSHSSLMGVLVQRFLLALRQVEHKLGSPSQSPSELHSISFTSRIIGPLSSRLHYSFDDDPEEPYGTEMDTDSRGLGGTASEIDG